MRWGPWGPHHTAVDAKALGVQERDLWHPGPWASARPPGTEPSVSTQGEGVACSLSGSGPSRKQGEGASPTQGWTSLRPGLVASSAAHVSRPLPFSRTPESQAPAGCTQGANPPSTQRPTRRSLWRLVASSPRRGPRVWPPRQRAGRPEQPAEARGTCSAPTACGASVTSRARSSSDTWPSAACEPGARGASPQSPRAVERTRSEGTFSGAGGGRHSGGLALLLVQSLSPQAVRPRPEQEDLQAKVTARPQLAPGRCSVREEAGLRSGAPGPCGHSGPARCAAARRPQPRSPSPVPARLLPATDFTINAPATATALRTRRGQGGGPAALPAGQGSAR